MIVQLYCHRIQIKIMTMVFAIIFFTACLPIDSMSLLWPAERLHGHWLCWRGAETHSASSRNGLRSGQNHSEDWEASLNHGYVRMSRREENFNQGQERTLLLREFSVVRIFFFCRNKGSENTWRIFFEMPSDHHVLNLQYPKSSHLTENSAAGGWSGLDLFCYNPHFCKKIAFICSKQSIFPNISLGCTASSTYMCMLKYYGFFCGGVQSDVRHCVAMSL